LDNNEIEYLPESIGRLKKLKVLSLKNNRLKKLPNSLSGLEELETLVISKNNIKKLPKETMWAYYIYAPHNNFSFIDIFKYKIEYGIKNFVI